MEDWDPQVLVVEANPRYLSTPKAQRWMKQRCRPVIGWGLGIPVGGGWLRVAIRNRLLAGFDALITYSQTGAAQYRAAGFPSERVFVAPNAVTRRPDASPPHRSPDFQDGRGRLLFVGRLQARKRIDLLLQACARLPEAVQPALAVVGEGPERPALQALAAQVYPRAEFTGDLRGEALAQRFRAADLFILPGTGGLAVQQAMSYALPVLVAEADGTQADLVRPGNGRVLPPGDLDGLTAALHEALTDPARLRRMGQESYRIVAEEINLEKMVEVFAAAVSEVI
jgi:glycosyltransferase involved in cell wall biosynthesis